jgi:hypothetical protein
VAGISYASIPDSSGVIHGCRNTSTGALRVINAPKQVCSSSEKALNWNQTGPAGPPGPVLSFATAQSQERDTFDTGGTWVAVPGASLAVQLSTGGVVDARFWAAPACFGSGEKYAEVLFDHGAGQTPGGLGQLGSTTPLAALPPSATTQSEVSAALEMSATLTAGPHTVSVSFYTQTGSSCVTTAGEWHLTVETVTAS